MDEKKKHGSSSIYGCRRISIARSKNIDMYRLYIYVYFNNHVRSRSAVATRSREEENSARGSGRALSDKKNKDQE